MRVLSRLVEAVGLVGLLLGPLASALPATAPAAAHAQAAGPSAGTGLYRVRVTVPDQARRKRLDALGVRVLQQSMGQAIVLVDGTQLERLARLRFEPGEANEFGELVAAHAVAKPWLASSLAPQVARLTAAQQQRTLGALSAEAAAQQAQAVVGALSVQQAAGLTVDFA